ncbi:MAG: MaoC/PaaZ C-terminal domain-containing protein [Parvibaculum sp.]|nr:MaoC/PaaZ C-terminal domain-containing protein [Parvibaculum sp.]
MRHFDDFIVGERHDIPARYEMSESEIVSFATKWDPQPFHINKDAAAKSIYGTLTACGTHIQAVVLFLAARLPEETNVLGALGYDEVRFHKAAKLHDTLRLVIECIETKPSASKPDRGVVKNRHILMNQDDEVIFTQTTTLLIKRKS